MAAAKDVAVAHSPAASSAGTGADAAAVVVVPMPTGEHGTGPRSIYSLWSRRRRGIILATVSLAAVLVPLTDVIILPALTIIQHDLKTTQELAAATVAIYSAHPLSGLACVCMCVHAAACRRQLATRTHPTRASPRRAVFTVGLLSLLWGPASDRFGRRTIYLVSTAAFIATSLVCVFAPGIGLLIAFRALQGASGDACLLACWLAHAACTLLANAWLPQRLHARHTACELCSHSCCCLLRRGPPLRRRLQSLRTPPRAAACWRTCLSRRSAA